jgi:SET domain-containing protein
MAARVKPVRRKLVEVRRSPIQGRGVFAVVDIPKGKRVIEYTGERMSSDAASDRYFDDDARARHHTFLFAVSDKVVVDARVGGNDARYINHSCAPNCEPIIERGRIFIYAKKKIAAGTELAYDYWYTTDDTYSDADLRRIYPCRCGAPKCRGTLAAKRATKKSAPGGAPPREARRGEARAPERRAPSRGRSAARR